MMKKQNKCITVVVSMVLIAALCVMAVSGHKLASIQQVYVTGDSNYDELRGLVFQRTDTRKADINATAGPLVDIPPYGIDFDALKKVNPDTTAWLHSPDTVIDYPVAHATDYAWYLHHLPDGTYNLNGTLFLDFNCEPNFDGRLSIIYGHNMKSGKMFGSLGGYKKQAYFEKHPYLYLYTDRGNYRIDLKFGCVIGAGEWRERAFMFEFNLDALLSYAKANTTFQSGVEYSVNDRFIVLSTCSYEFDQARYFVVGVLRPENGT